MPGTSVLDTPGFAVDWSGGGVTGDVPAWLNNPSRNFGCILIGSDFSQAAKRFDSRNNGSTFDRPLLRVTYTVPEPDAHGAQLAAFGALVALRVGRRRLRG